MRVAENLKITAAEPAGQVPLVVDLDGTLIRTDLLLETANAFVTRRPMRAPALLSWVVRGKSVLKSPARLCGHR